MSGWVAAKREAGGWCGVLLLWTCHWTAVWTWAGSPVRASSQGYDNSAAFVMVTEKEMLQRGPSTNGAVHGSLVVPCKYLYRPSRWLPQLWAAALQVFIHNPSLRFLWLFLLPWAFRGSLLPAPCVRLSFPTWMPIQGDEGLNSLNTSLEGSKGLSPAAGRWGLSQPVKKSCWREAWCVLDRDTEQLVIAETCHFYVPDC